MLCLYMFLVAVLSLIIDFAVNHIRPHVNRSARRIIDDVNLVCVIVGVIAATAAFCLYMTGNGPI